MPISAWSCICDNVVIYSSSHNKPEIKPKCSPLNMNTDEERKNRKEQTQYCCDIENPCSIVGRDWRKDVETIDVCTHIASTGSRAQKRILGQEYRVSFKEKNVQRIGLKKQMGPQLYSCVGGVSLQITQTIVR